MEIRGQLQKLVLIPPHELWSSDSDQAGNTLTHERSVWPSGEASKLALYFLHFKKINITNVGFLFHKTSFDFPAL